MNDFVFYRNRRLNKFFRSSLYQILLKFSENEDKKEQILISAEKQGQLNRLALEDNKTYQTYESRAYLIF